MRIASPVLDDIRERLPISAVVGRRVRFDPRKSQPGRGDFWGCCPFHQEKTPSFHCDDRRGIYYCFGCGASGDHFRFLMETEGVGFMEAVERLAREAGVALPQTPREEAETSARAGLSDALKLAENFFRTRLRGPRGGEARTYLAQRGIKSDTIETFAMGYAPDSRDALKNYLLAEGVSEEIALGAGLLIKPEDGRSTYDRFRGRLMIPIHDTRGRTVAFGGRTLDPRGEPKYLNSPETPLFHKGMMLFNLHRAKEPAREAGSVIVTEGYMDTIALHQAGIFHAVAALGTAFTEDHAARLWQLAREPVICFDGDPAGLRAAHRALERILPLLKPGFSFNFCFLPEGKDPDDLVRAEGADRFLAEIARARPLIEVLWERETTAARIDTPEHKAALEARLEALVATIRDGRVARRYRLALRAKLSELFWQRDRGGRRGIASPAGPQLPIAALRPPEDAELAEIERILLGLCIEYPALFEKNIERLAELSLHATGLEDFKRTLQALPLALDSATAESIYQALDRESHMLLNEIHGEAIQTPDGRLIAPRGHRLHARLPLLRQQPSEAFIEDFFELLLEKLHLRALAADLAREMVEISGREDEEALTRLLGLSQELTQRREALSQREQTLADAAKALKGSSGF